MFIEAPEAGTSTCRSTDPVGEVIGRTYGYVNACQNVLGKHRNIQAVEDVESRAHKAATFVVERDTEIKELRALKMPKALPGCVVLVKCHEETRRKEEHGENEEEHVARRWRWRRCTQFLQMTFVYSQAAIS